MVKIRNIIQISSVCTIMHMLADKLVEQSMNQVLSLNPHASLFSIVRAGGPV